MPGSRSFVSGQTNRIAWSPDGVALEVAQLFLKHGNETLGVSPQSVLGLEHLSV